MADQTLGLCSGGWDILMELKGEPSRVVDYEDLNSISSSVINSLDWHNHS